MGQSVFHQVWWKIDWPISRRRNRLARLTDDIRDVSAAEEGRLALRPRWVEPGDLVEQVRLAAEAAFERAGVRLSVTGGRLPPVEADPDRIAQVLDNLLSNALRHTPRGGRVTLAAEAHTRRVTFVTDTGSASSRTPSTTSSSGSSGRTPFVTGTTAAAASGSRSAAPSPARTAGS